MDLKSLKQRLSTDQVAFLVAYLLQNCDENPPITPVGVRLLGEIKSIAYRHEQETFEGH